MGKDEAQVGVIPREQPGFEGTLEDGAGRSGGGVGGVPSRPSTPVMRRLCVVVAAASGATPVMVVVVVVVMVVAPRTTNLTMPSSGLVFRGV